MVVCACPSQLELKRLASEDDQEDAWVQFKTDISAELEELGKRVVIVHQVGFFENQSTCVELSARSFSSWVMPGGKFAKKPKTLYMFFADTPYSDDEGPSEHEQNEVKIRAIVVSDKCVLAPMRCHMHYLPLLSIPPRCPPQLSEL